MKEIINKNILSLSNEDIEKQKGRIPLWLDVADIEWLSSHCCCPENASQEIKDRCMRVRFRCHAALHKSNNK